MVTSNAGLLCLSCGHMEPSGKTKPPAASPAAEPPAAATPAPASPEPVPNNMPILPTRPRSARRPLLIAAVLAVVAALGAAAYITLVSPTVALPDYLARLVKAKTTTLATGVTSSNKDYRISLKLSGKDDLTNAAKPKLDLTVTGELSSGQGATPLGGAASGSLSAHTIVADQTVYFKIESFSYLTQLLSVK